MTKGRQKPPSRRRTRTAAEAAYMVYRLGVRLGQFDLLTNSEPGLLRLHTAYEPNPHEKTLVRQVHTELVLAYDELVRKTKVRGPPRELGRSQIDAALAGWEYRISGGIEQPDSSTVESALRRLDELIREWIARRSLPIAHALAWFELGREIVFGEIPSSDETTRDAEIAPQWQWFNAERIAQLVRTVGIDLAVVFPNDSELSGTLRVLPQQLLGWCNVDAGLVTLQEHLVQLQQRRRSPVAPPQVLRVANWSEVAIGIDENRDTWALTPVPARGAQFPIRSAMRISIGGEHWPELVEQLASSATGQSARKSDLATAWKYAGGQGEAERDDLWNDELRVSETHVKRRIAQRVADISRSLRKFVKTSESGAAGPLSAASADMVEAAFIAQHLVRDESGRLRFGTRG